ncbi:unnamed protein product [Adineta steineri]|uniref:Secreted protein n=1 Tax=Adineta steineri TaxID=433720 RepID=A0A815GIM5_9BILA|nr:unnamed protein product [Adineta steineri]
MRYLSVNIFLLILVGPCSVVCCTGGVGAAPSTSVPGICTPCTYSGAAVYCTGFDDPTYPTVAYFNGGVTAGVTGCGYTATALGTNVATAIFACPSG